MNCFQNFINETLQHEGESNIIKIFDVEYIGDNRLAKELAYISIDEYVDFNIFFIENEILDGHNIKKIFLYCIDFVIPESKFFIHDIKDKKLKSSLFSEINRLIKRRRLIKINDNYFFNERQSIFDKAKNMIVYDQNIIDEINQNSQGKNLNFYIEIYKKFFNNKRWKDIETEISIFLENLSKEYYKFDYIRHYEDSIEFIFYYLNKFKDVFLTNKLNHVIKQILEEYSRLISRNNTNYNRKISFEQLDFLLNLFYPFILKNKELRYQVSNLVDEINHAIEFSDYNYKIFYEKTKKLVKMFS